MPIVYKTVLQISLLLIGFYQRFISPLKKPSCRFYPTCSNYARDSFLNHGLFYGFYLTFRRLLRCNPFCEGGYDPPVPGKKSHE